MRISESLKGALGQAKDMATDFAGQHSSSIDIGLDKVGEMANSADTGESAERTDPRPEAPPASWRRRTDEGADLTATPSVRSRRRRSSRRRTARPRTAVQR